jgi:hypothetical protein
MTVSSLVAIVYMDSYYARRMIHAYYIWMLLIANIGVYMDCGYGSKTKMGASTLC